MAKVIANMGSLMRKLDSLGGNVQKALTRGMRITLQSAQGSANRRKPYGSIRIQEEMKATADKVEGKVFSNTPWAAYVEFGTGPVGAADHDGISPNVAVTYHPTSWAWPTGEKDANGKEIFVTTRGQPAKPYLYPASKENESVFEGETRKAVLEEIRRMGG